MVAPRAYRSKTASARIAKALARQARAESARACKIMESPAALAARLGVATFDEFGALILRGPRTVARMEPLGLPVIRPGRQPLVLVERALKWLEAGKPRPRTVGRPRNVDRGGSSGGRR